MTHKRNTKIPAPAQCRKKAGDQVLSNSWATLRCMKHYKNLVCNFGKFMNRNT